MLDDLKLSFQSYNDRPAFCIQGEYFTYGELGRYVAGTCELLNNCPSQNIAIAAYDDISTYAAVVSCLISGKTYVPLNPDHPLQRNMSVLEQSDAAVLFTSFPEQAHQLAGDMAAKLELISVKKGLPVAKVPDVVADPSLNAYLLFTSGSTGLPKGVPISRAAVSGFLESFFALGFDLNEQDRVLQMFDLTFDLSVMSYLAPLLRGACVYTVPHGEVKFTAVYSLLETHEITVALMVPSVLNFLKPYFDEIELPRLRYSLFCGEALYTHWVRGWKNSVPNARIVNVYGPTEATIFCMYYDFSENNAEEHNGILSIGKPMVGVDVMIADAEGKMLPQGTTGELCLSGRQLTSGYWKDESKTREAFFLAETASGSERFYRTGDLAYLNQHGNYMYCGRTDNQVKIQGFRVELSEIEHHASSCPGCNAAIAVPDTDAAGNDRLLLAVEAGGNFSAENLMSHLKSRLPAYMVPAKIHCLPSFPLNANGKTDRRAIRTLLSNLS